ncbi:hypothetical protein CP082626L3_0017A, partial [Chlamydia psittaci 08-2626_L3]
MSVGAPASSVTLQTNLSSGKGKIG